MGGDKRTGAVASLVVLMINEEEVQADEDSFEKMVISTAEGKTSKAVIAEFLRNSAGNER